MEQLSLFGDGEDRMQPPVQSYAPDPERVRRRLLALLEQARAAQAMPWPEREARMWRTVFPQMANWLPQDEAERLRSETARRRRSISTGGSPCPSHSAYESRHGLAGG